MTNPRPQNLDAPDLLDFLECIPSTPDFRPGSLMLLPADARAELMICVALDEMEAEPPQHERERVLTQTDLGVAGIGFLICRLGSSLVCGDDLAWHDAAVIGCMRAELRWHGAFVVTARGAARVLTQ